LKVKTLALLPLFLIVLMACLQTPIATAPVPTPPPPAELLWRDPIGTYDIALSKDGQYVAAVGPVEVVGAELRFYGRSSETPIWTYSLYTTISFFSVAISADGDCVAIGTEHPLGGDVRFWTNAKSRTPGNTDPSWTSIFLGGPIDRRCLDISDDGNYVVACGTGESVFYWRDAKSKSGSGISPTWQNSIGDDVTAVDLSSDGDYVAAGYTIGNDNSVAYWKNTRTLSGTPSPDWASTEPSDVEEGIIDIAVSDDGNYVAAAAWFDTVYYWANAKSLSGNPPTKWWSGTGISFTSIDMSSDGDEVVAGSEGTVASTGKGVYFWSGAKGLSGKPQNPTWFYDTTPNAVEDVAINTAGDYMAAANGVLPDRVYFFDSSGNSLWNPPYQVDNPVRSLSISSDGGTLAIGTGLFVSRYLVSTGFKTPPPKPVGGYAVPVNKLAILSPYLALLGLFGAVTLAVAARRRRKP